MKTMLRKLHFVLLLLPIAAMSQWTQLGDTIDSATPPGSANIANFGESVALSEDGTIMAVGAPARGLSEDGASYVQVFRFESGEWVQIGSTIEGISSNTSYSENRVGVSIGLSADGSVLAVGEQNWNVEDGRVRMFRNINDEWVQIGEDIAELGVDDFGSRLSLSSDGDVVAIHGIADDLWAGMVKVFQNVSDSWVQIGGTIQGAEMFGMLGYDMSMNADGTKLALIQVEGFFFPTIVIYEYVDSEWEHTSTIFDGGVPSLSADGTKLAIGETTYSDQSGRVKLYSWSTNDWVEEATFEPQNPVANGGFGQTVSMSANTDVIVIGTDTQGRAVNVYQNTDSGWELAGEFNVEEGMTGRLIPALSANGSVLAIGERVRNSDDDPNNFIFYRSATVYKNCDLATIQIPQIENTDFTEGDTLADLDVTAEGTLTWYADEDLTIVLEEDTPLVNETTYYVTQTDAIGCTSEATAVTVSFLDLTDFVQNHFSYYPNPVKDVLNFTIENDNVQAVQLYDLSGKLVFEQKSGQTIGSVNLSVLPKAMYIAKIQTERDVYTFKLVKE